MTILARTLILALLGLACTLYAVEPAAPAPRPIPTPQEYLDRSLQFSERLEQNLNEPYIGITTDGSVAPNLYPIKSTGVSTGTVVMAANNFLKLLSESEAQISHFPVDDPEWRKWANQHIYRRQGLSFERMTSRQRDAAFRLLSESTSAKGLALSRDIMRLNETLAELNDNNNVDYGEWKYHITIMGEPSLDTPWGWQLDGHHLNLNYFVLGDQVVMSPAFWGSEPTVAHAGKYKGTRIMDAEQTAGLSMIRSLSPEQSKQAILDVSKPGNNILAQAFSDNLVLDYAGISASTFNDHQARNLLSLIELYIGNLRAPHAKHRMSEIKAHLADTYFSWIGGTQDDSVFYYRIHSPVVLIEFDHENPVGLRHIYPNGPNREHIHAVVRTPNGNDYGKDLLRQHYLERPHN